MPNAPEKHTGAVQSSCLEDPVENKDQRQAGLSVTLQQEIGKRGANELLREVDP